MLTATVIGEMALRTWGPGRAGAQGQAQERPWERSWGGAGRGQRARWLAGAAGRHAAAPLLPRLRQSAQPAGLLPALRVVAF
jgi:hypothetical protein